MICPAHSMLLPVFVFKLSRPKRDNSFCGETSGMAPWSGNGKLHYLRGITIQCAEGRTVLLRNGLERGVTEVGTAKDSSFSFRERRIPEWISGRRFRRR